MKCLVIVIVIQKRHHIKLIFQYILAEVAKTDPLFPVIFFVILAPIGPHVFANLYLPHNTLFQVFCRITYTC